MTGSPRDAMESYSARSNAVNNLHSGVDDVQMIVMRSVLPWLSQNPPTEKAQ